MMTMIIKRLFGRQNSVVHSFETKLHGRELLSCLLARKSTAADAASDTVVVCRSRQFMTMHTFPHRRLSSLTRHKNQCRYLSSSSPKSHCGDSISRSGRKHTKGYVSMGSFHSENVDELMAMSDVKYGEPPALPFEPYDTGSGSTEARHSVDKNCKDDNFKRNFMLDLDKWTFINHGAFGAALRVGVERAERWRQHLESQPLRYFDRELLPHLVYSARRLASFCHVPHHSRHGLTLIPNVTYGLNTVLNGYVNNVYGNRRSSDGGDQSKGYHTSSPPPPPHVILWDTSYGSLKKMAHEYVALKGGKVTEIPVSQYFHRFKWDNVNNDNGPDKGIGESNNDDEADDDIFMDALADVISQFDAGASHENCLFILDHTTSNTALDMPIDRLSKFGHDRGWIVMVDGAHGVLAHDLDFSTASSAAASSTTNMEYVDIYVGNCHKWLSSPRGVGFMYCPDTTIQETILRHPAVMSHGIGQGYQSRFLWDGCRDYAAALSIPAVLDFWERTGVDDVRKAILDGRNQAIAILGKIWHGTTDRITLAPLDVHSPMMVLVRLPDHVQPNDDKQATSEEAKSIQDFLYDHFVEVPIKVVGGLYYARISSHIYNNANDYAELGEVMLQYRK